MPVKRSLAVLVGNGLSIAFNPALNLRTITSTMLERIQEESSEGSDVIAAMKEIAERALPSGATGDNDFEVLVGAFGAESRTLDHLEELASLVSPKDAKLKRAISRVRDFAEKVRDTGLSHVLEVIFEESVASREQSSELHELVNAICRDFDGKVAIGNLNYDTLLLSALLFTCKEELSDMGHGYLTVTVESSAGGTKQVPRLRTTNDFPPLGASNYCTCTALSHFGPTAINPSLQNLTLTT